MNVLDYWMQMQIKQIKHVEIINWLFMNWKVSFTKLIMAQSSHLQMPSLFIKEIDKKKLNYNFF